MDWAQQCSSTAQPQACTLEQGSMHTSQVLPHAPAPLWRPPPPASSAEAPSYGPRVVTSSPFRTPQQLLHARSVMRVSGMQPGLRVDVTPSAIEQHAPQMALSRAHSVPPANSNLPGGGGRGDALTGIASLPLPSEAALMRVSRRNIVKRLAEMGGAGAPEQVRALCCFLPGILVFEVQLFLNIYTITLRGDAMPAGAQPCATGQ